MQEREVAVSDLHTALARATEKVKTARAKLDDFRALAATELT